MNQLKNKITFLRTIIFAVAISPGLCFPHFLTTIKVKVINYNAQGSSVIETSTGNRYALSSKYLPANFRDKGSKSKYFPLTVLYSELTPLSKTKASKSEKSPKIKIDSLPDNIFYRPASDIL